MKPLSGELDFSFEVEKLGFVKEKKERSDHGEANHSGYANFIFIFVLGEISRPQSLENPCGIWVCQ